MIPPTVASPKPGHITIYGMQLAVNLANGNLVIADNDLSVAGTGQNLALDHVCNNLIPDSAVAAQGRKVTSGYRGDGPSSRWPWCRRVRSKKASG